MKKSFIQQMSDMMKKAKGFPKAGQAAPIYKNFWVVFFEAIVARFYGQ